MNALEFVNANENVILFYSGVGCPAGESTALLDETELWFDLAEIEGEVDADGVFQATNLNDGSGLHGWKIGDGWGNAITKVQLYCDAKQWKKQKDEFDACPF